MSPVRVIDIAISPFAEQVVNFGLRGESLKLKNYVIKAMLNLATFFIDYGKFKDNSFGLNIEFNLGKTQLMVL